MCLGGVGGTQGGQARLVSLSRDQESLTGCHLARQGACGVLVLGARRCRLGPSPARAGLPSQQDTCYSASCTDTVGIVLLPDPGPRCAGFLQEFRAGREGAVIGRQLQRPVVTGAVWVPEARWASQHSLSLTRWGPRDPWYEWRLGIHR